MTYTRYVTALLHKVVAWAARNERRLGAALFIFGFVGDLFTYGLLPANIIALIFGGYLLVAAVASFVSHILPEADMKTGPWGKRTLAVLAPLVAQYALGNLLSGLTVFYTKSADIAASWPFLALILLAYFASEYFRKYKDYLVFQTSLFFLTFYACAIFALPLAVGTLGPWVFAGSSVIACVAFALFLLGLRLSNLRRYLESRKAIVASGAALLLLVNAAYFSGIIPPLPLALAESGAYHGLMRVTDGYRVQQEGERAWWDIRTQVIHHVPGTPLYAFSAVRAPIKFSSTVVHRWERLGKNGWTTMSRIAFPIAGGREGGYRGYSERSDLPEGTWRVSVETPGGQVIGRIRFDIESADVEPALIEKTR